MSETIIQNPHCDECQDTGFTEDPIDACWKCAGKTETEYQLLLLERDDVPDTRQLVLIYDKSA
jgi:hypothetical protein